MAKLKMEYVKPLYVQVIFGIILGLVTGLLSPELALSLKPFSDAFIKLIKMLIAPIIFLSLVSGITSMDNLGDVGKIGGLTLAYFMITTTLALTLGLISAHVFQPGMGLVVAQEDLELAIAQHGTYSMHQVEPRDFLLNIIPTSFFSAFAEGELLQVVLVSILFSLGLMMVGAPAKPLLKHIQLLSRIFFKMIHFVMYLAPMAAFAAIAFFIGQFGLASFVHLLKLLLVFYTTCLFFVVVVLGTLLRVFCKISVFKLIRFIKTELLIALGTSSSETVLPNLMQKLETLGCRKNVVGLVLPVGYSFNLDGTAIYLTLAALFIAQALHVELTLQQQVALLLIMIVSSKGAAGVSGSGFVVLASSLAAIKQIPVSGIILIMGIDRLMSDGRTLTNILGNAIATILIASWLSVFNHKKARKRLHQQQVRLHDMMAQRS